MPPCWHRPVPAQGGCASLLAQLGEDPFGQRAASHARRAGVDTAHTRFSRTLPTALLFEADGEALSYRARTAGLQFAPEQLEPGLFQPGTPCSLPPPPMRQPAAVHPFSGPHRRPGCPGP